MALRVIALVGLAWASLEACAGSFPLAPRQDLALMVLIPAPILVLLAIWWFMPEAWQGARRCPALLVPIGVRCAALEAAHVLGGMMPEVVTTSHKLPILAFTLTASIWTLASILINVAYAAWQTRLILRAVRGETATPEAALADVPRLLMRTLGLMMLGAISLLLPLGLLVWLTQVGALSAWMAMFAMGIWALVLNLATAAVLPFSLAGGSLPSCIGETWRGLGRVWPVVVAQMLLIGWTMYFDVSYETPDGGVRHQQFKVHGQWTGAYTDDCEWYDELMNQVDQDGAPIFTLASSLLFSLLAIAAKWTIVARLFRPAPAEYDVVFA